jgi:hypothetical protein
MITPVAYEALNKIMEDEDSENFLTLCDEKGICLECGEIADDIEPDDDNCQCEHCSEFAVMGLTMAIVNYY